MVRLVRAQLWRVWWFLPQLVFLGLVGAYLTNSVGARMSGGFALMMTASSLSMLGMFWSREVRVLPIRPETALRSVWCTAMFFPAAILLGRLLAILNRLLPNQVLNAVIVSALTLAASTAVSVGLRGELRSPFDTRVSDVEFLLIGGPLFLLLLGPVWMGTGLTPFLRRLKAMPISARRVVLTMTALPLMTPLLFWVAAGAVHLTIDTPGPGNWRPGALLFLCGVLALASALIARFNSAIATGIGGVFPLVGILVLMMFFDNSAIEPVIAVVLPAVGLAGLSAALLLNYHTITRASSHAAAYRPPGMPIGQVMR